MIAVIVPTAEAGVDRPDGMSGCYERAQTSLRASLDTHRSSPDSSSIENGDGMPSTTRVVFIF